jgi:hypothetical protein
LIISDDIHYFNFLLADTGQNRIQQDIVTKVPVAIADVICSIRFVSKSPRFAEPSRTTIINIIMKHKLEADHLIKVQR